MALKIGDNFNYQGQKPNFERDSFDTLAAMKAYPETSIDDGHLSYCKEDGKRYEFKTSNTVDETTGKWREFSSGLSESYYIIDYMINGEGTITEKQYNEIVNAITNNFTIYLYGANVYVTSIGAAIIENMIFLFYDHINVSSIIQIDNTYKYSITAKEFILNPMRGITGQVLKKTTKGVEWANDNDTTYNKATHQADGLMSKEDKAKLDGLTGASLKILTQEEYDATEPKAEDTVYFIKG